MEEKKLTVTFVNVGYGEAILLECPDPSRPGGVFTALIDGGSAEESEFADRTSGRLPVEEYLTKRGIWQSAPTFMRIISADCCGRPALPPRMSCGRPFRRISTNPCPRWTAPRPGRPRRASFSGR